MNASRAAAATAIVLLASACERERAGERVVQRGIEQHVVSVCTHGSPDVGAMRRRFDWAVPGLKGNGFPRAAIVAALHRDGGVLIEYAGRTFHSGYLHDTGNWESVEEPMTAAASVVAIGGRGAGADPDTVYVEVPIWKHGRRFDGVFFPWSTPHDDSSPCEGGVR